MAEKEVKLKVTTETDIKDVEDLESKLQELQDTKLQMQLEADTQELDDVNSQIEETQSKLDELRADPTVDDSEIQALEDELAELEGRQIDLEIAVNTAELDQAKASMDELESSSQGATSSIDGVGSALTAVAATAGLERMVTTADNINNSWNRLELTFAGTGVSIDQLKQKQTELQASTGQTGGTIREYFNRMGIAGVTNTNLLASSFEALSGKAYQTGQSVEEMEGKFQRMVMTGNASGRMLTSLGIQTEDLAQAMGVSADQVQEAFKNLTPEERIRALTQAMGDGKQANEMYKNSFQGLKTQAEAALAGLVGAIGQAILPVIIPILKLATQVITGLADAFKKLPAPVQAVIGGIGGVALAGAALVGVLGVVGQVVKTVKEGIQALNGIMRIWEVVTKAVELAQAALNFVMAMNPIFLVIIAIVALIAILWYLYNTNESVREAIDGFIASLWSIGETIYGYLVGAFEWLQGAWQNTVDFFTTYGQTFLDILLLVLTGPIGAIWLLITNFDQLKTSIFASLEGARQIVVTKLEEIKQWFYSKIRFIADIVRDGANRIYHFFIDPIIKIKESVAAELEAVKSTVMRYIQPLIDAFNTLGSAASWAFSVLGLGQRSPGDIYKAMKNELEWTTEFVEKDKAGLMEATGQLGSGVSGSFNPGFNVVSGSIDMDNVAVNGGYDVEGLLNRILDALTNLQKGNGSLTFNMYGDMDSEERMERFLDYVRRAIEWNNDTAGRSV